MVAFATTIWSEQVSMLTKEFKLEVDKPKTFKAEATLELKDIEGRSKLVLTIHVKNPSATQEVK